MTEKDKIQHNLLHDDKMNRLIDHVRWSKQLIKKDIHVLVADDVNVQLKLLTSFIEKSGGKTYEAANGKEALDIFKKVYVDLVVIDLHMPVMNGFEATYKIKEHAGNNYVPVIIFTAFSNNEIIAKAQACGADDLIEKPISYDLFCIKINTLIRLKEFYDKEKEFSRQLQMEIQERKAANARLIEFQQQLEASVEKKTAQLRQKDLELLEMDRIASINTLAAGMAHEINNPLGFMQASVDTLKKITNSFIDNKDSQDQTFSKRTEQIFSRIYKGIKRISYIINALRYLSNVDKRNVTPININKSIEEAIALFHLKEETEPRLTTIFSNLPEIKCIGAEINLCLMNVIKNARDAVLEQKNGAISISTRFNDIDAQIIICVQDNGPGIPPEKKRRVFDPFFTTKPVGEGTGVGLTLTERILTRYGGKISLDSQTDKGTAVTIVLPINQDCDL